MMRQLVLRALGRPAGFVLGRLLRLSSRPLAVALMYHRLDERSGDRERELVPAHSTRLFERQLRHLRSTYRPVPASRLVEEAERRRRGGRIPVAVTFDDDQHCHRALAMPVLDRLGVPATFFLSGASLERPLSFWWERLQRAVDRGVAIERIVAHVGGAPGASTIHAAAASIEEMDPAHRDSVAEQLLDLAGPDPEEAGMRSADVRALAEARLEIGFHTLRHYRLTGLDDTQLKTAMTEGREPLATLTGAQTDVIAYPHGKADARVASAARAAGFRVGFKSLPGAVEPGDDELLLRRVEPSFVSAGHFAAQVAGALLGSRRTAGRA